MLMDLGAELTLQIARLVHERPEPPRSPASWMFWPMAREGNWETARTILAEAPKPLFVSPLMEPGMLGVWTFAMLDAPARARAEAELRNQVEYFAAKLEKLGFGEGDQVRFEAATPPLTITVREFLHWAGEYALNLGVTVQRTDDPGVARILIIPTREQGRPPLGMVVDPYAAPLPVPLTS